MAKPKQPIEKLLELKRTGTLNPHPSSVSDTLFKENPFFDPKDLLQVRYEMLRRHSVEGSLDRRCGCHVWRVAPYCSIRPKPHSSKPA